MIRPFESPPQVVRSVKRFSTSLPGYFFNRPCGNQMGTKFWEVVCDEHGIGSGGEYCGDNDAHLGRINVLYHEALGGKYVPHAVLFNLETAVTNALRAPPLCESSFAWAAS
jgi:hypothetical protein